LGGSAGGVAAMSGTAGGQAFSGKYGDLPGFYETFVIQ
jgi:hypothetical protein